MNPAPCASIGLSGAFAQAASRLDEATWNELKNARILLTGGTGFVGKWLLGTFLAANEAHELDAEICILTRDPDGFAATNPGLAGRRGVTLVAGDITAVAAATAGHLFTHVVHAATEASAKLNREDPLRMIDTIVDGTRALLELLRHNPPKHLLFISSGAVYGPQPASLTALPEDWNGGPDPLGAGSAYHEAKRLAEQLCAAASRSYGFEQVHVARLFAFVGPYLPLDTHFAIGNFIRDALAGKVISLTGDGSTIRSYLSASDMAAWTWATLLRGQHLRAYNIGSANAISTRDLAHLVARLVSPQVAVEIRGQAVAGRPLDRYVPAIERACSELGLAEWTPLEDAILQTIAHHHTS